MYVGSLQSDGDNIRESVSSLHSTHPLSVVCNLRLNVHWLDNSQRHSVRYILFPPIQQRATPYLSCTTKVSFLFPLVLIHRYWPREILMRYTCLGCLNSFLCCHPRGNLGNLSPHRFNTCYVVYWDFDLYHNGYSRACGWPLPTRTTGVLVH